MASQGDTSFDDLEKELDDLDEKGVPDAFLAAHRKLRAELKNKRERYTPFEEAFSALTPDDAEALLSVARTLPENPEAVAKWMLDTSKTLGGEAFPEWIAAETGGLSDNDDPAEPAEGEADVAEEKSIEERVAEAVQAALAERDAKTEQERMVEEQRRVIESKLKELGYDDPGAPDAQVLLFQAKAIGGDPLDAITQAHEKLEEHYVEKAQQYAAQKSADAGAPAPPVGEEGSTVEQGEAQPDADDSPEALAKARLDSVFGAADPEASLI